MRNSFISSAAALGVVLLAAGCGSSTGPGGGLTTTQQTALTNAIVSSNALGTQGGALAPFLIATVGNTGTLSASISRSFSRQSAISADVSNIDATWDAAGAQVVFNVNLGAQGSFSGAYSGVVGWNFNSAGDAVTDLITAGALAVSGTAAPTTGTYAITADPQSETYGSASYWDGTNTFDGTDGSFVLSSASFGGSTTDCPSVSTGTQATVTCSYTTGTMGGNFNFSGEDNAADTYTQSNTTFSGLPSVLITVSITQ